MTSSKIELSDKLMTPLSLRTVSAAMLAKLDVWRFRHFNPLVLGDVIRMVSCLWESCAEIFPLACPFLFIDLVTKSPFNGTVLSRSKSAAFDRRRFDASSNNLGEPT